MLSVEGVEVRFGETVALSAVDLVVEEGEVACVLGPSGSGKTTLLRAVAGLEPLSAGRIALDGRPLAGVPTHRRQIGLMFQEFALFPHHDVRGNVAFGLRMRGDDRRTVDARVAEVLGVVGLAGFEERRVGELSGGERQRVALARAVAPSPRLLMLDEPLGSLDRGLRDRLIDELPTMFSELGTTVLYVTHDQTEAMGLADRVVVMNAGLVHQHGPPDEIWNRPADAFVASFVGSAALVDAVAGGGRLELPWGSVPMPPSDRAVEGPVSVAIGRDALWVQPAGTLPRATPVPADTDLDGDGAGTIRGTVERRVFRGDDFLLAVRADDVVLHVAATADAAPGVGEPVILGLRVDRIRVLR